MSTRVNRRSFLKQGASSLLATSLCPACLPESDALQQSRREAPPHTADPGGPPYPTEERINRSDGHDLRERVTYVCGRGEVENYFRSMPKPAGYEHNLGTNCELRIQAPYAGIKEIEAYFSTHPQKRPCPFFSKPWNWLSQYHNLLLPRNRLSGRRLGQGRSVGV